MYMPMAVKLWQPQMATCTCPRKGIWLQGWQPRFAAGLERLLVGWTGWAVWCFCLWSRQEYFGKKCLQRRCSLRQQLLFQ